MEPRDDQDPASAVSGRPPHLDHEDLVRAQAKTLAAPRRRYGVLARILFTTLDSLYGKERTLSKFKVLELVARVPYQTWEQVAYIAITHMHSQIELARRIYDRVQDPGSSRTTSNGICSFLRSASPVPESTRTASTTSGSRRPSPSSTTTSPGCCS